MKRQIAIFALLLLFSHAITAEPAAWPDLTKEEDANKAAKVVVPKSAISKKTTESKRTKPKKTKKVPKPVAAKSARSSDHAVREDVNAKESRPPGVVDFMQPPVWADANYGQPVENTLPGFMQPGNLNLKHTENRSVGLRQKDDTSRSSKFFDKGSTSSAWMQPSNAAATAPDYTQNLYATRKLDLGWSTPKFGAALPGWRMNNPRLDTPYMRVQRSQNDYQQARDSLEQLYQRWAPVKK